MTDGAAPLRPHRLNPFAFPSETDSRFVLLVLAVIGSALFVFRWLALMVPGAYEALLDVVAHCSPLTAGIDVNVLNTSPVPDTERTDAVTAAARAGRECMAAYNLNQALWSFGGLGLLVLTAGAIYAIAPWLKIRASGSEPLDADDNPEMAAYLAELSREAGLKKSPTFLIAATCPTTSGLAFGHPGRRYVEMDGGLVILFFTDPPAFRAVILHELAHLRNGDVDKAYATIAMCVSFMLVGLIPFALSLAFRSDPLTTAQMVGRVVALGALILALGTATLRAREIYADVRASIWDGPDGALDRLLAEMGHDPPSPWRAPLRFHPDSLERQETLRDTRRLFSITFFDAFLTGAAATVAFENVSTVISWLTTPLDVPFLATTVAALLYAPLLTGIIGLGVWRLTFASLVLQEHRVDLAKPVLGLAAGMFAGQLLSLGSTVETGSYGALSPAKLLWVSVLALGTYLWLRWIQGNARTWFAALLSARSPRRVYWTGLAISSIVLTFWFALMYQFDGVLAGHAVTNDHLAVLAAFVPLFLAMTWLFLLTQPVVALLLISLWALPLASALFQRSASSVVPTWVSLDPGTEIVTSPQSLEYRLRQAVLVGMAGGLLYTMLLLGFRIYRRMNVPLEILDSDADKVTFAITMIGMAVAVQVLAASIVGAWVRHLSLVHGLLAAFTCGLVSFAAFIVLNLAFGGSADADFVWNIFRLIVNGGTLGAIPLAAVVVLMAGWIRGRGSQTVIEAAVD